jgi:hypothetical protein
MQLNQDTDYNMFTGPSIITDGLVLALDAANPNSYPGTGTTWNDLSGNGNNGTLVNGPTFYSGNAGSIVFDGANDLVNIPSAIITSGSNFSVSFFMYPLSRMNYNQGIGTAWGFFSFHTTSVGAVYAGTDISNRLTPSQLPSNTLLLNTWQCFSFVYNNPIGFFYKNGSLLASKSMNTTATWPAFVLATTLHGNISNLQIYNRALTPQEVQQNYNATKGRYNL